MCHAVGLTLNTNAFLVSTDLLGDEQQTKYWREQVYSGKAIGAYGQTELGHGSNVKDLETVAVYHEDKQKWIINSPSETSAKYWPGILGHFATHSVIQAKAIVKGKSIGVQTFVIELRN
jgi:acyl-CoA oxidase